MANSVRSKLIKILPERIFAALRVLYRPEFYVPLTDIKYRQDGLVTQHHANFMNEEKFVSAYSLGEATGSWNGWPTHWRSHVACWAAYRGKFLDGDFVECGVNKGAISRMVMEYIGFAGLDGRKFYLIDTYEGLSAEQISEEERAEGRHLIMYEECYEEVKRTFAPFANAIIVRGRIPEVLPKVEPDKVCYLSIDMNVAEPEIAAAEYFWDRMVPGAAMLLDDYGWLGHDVQRNAFNKFAADRNVPLLCLPTGQGLILKP